MISYEDQIKSFVNKSKDEIIKKTFIYPDYKLSDVENLIYKIITTSDFNILTISDLTKMQSVLKDILLLNPFEQSFFQSHLSSVDKALNTKTNVH